VKRGVVSALSAVLFMGALTATAATPPKVGATCAKLGSTQIVRNIKYTCIKSGSKKVWNKGVLINKASPTPTKSPAPTQTPTPSAQPTTGTNLESDGYPKDVPAPNRTCLEEGAKATLYGGNLTCIKGKWVLDPGSTISRSPTPTSSSPTPTAARPSTFVRVVAPLNVEIPDLNPSNALLDFDSQVALRARLEMLSRLSLKSTETPNIQWIIDPKADPIEIEQYQKEVPYAVQFYGYVRSPRTPVRIYLGSSANFQWLYDVLTKDLAPEGLEGNWLDAKLARAKSDPGFHGGAGGLVSKDGTLVVFFNYGSKMSVSETLQTQISFHEYTHVIQKAYLLGNMSPMLCWMREGYANYVGYNLTTRYSTAAYLNSWYQQFQYADAIPELNGWRTNTAKDWAQWFVNNEKKTPYECDSYDNYTIGSIAWEYIHGTYGYQAVDKFYRGLAKSYVGTCSSTLDSNNVICPGWKKLYLDTFGRSPESDYLNFGEYVVKKIEWMKYLNNLAGDDAAVLSPPAWKVPSKY